MALTTPSEAESLELFTDIEAKFPAATLGEDKWYILLLSSLVAGGHPELVATLYTELISRPRYGAAEARKALLRRFRESLMKLVSVVGVPKPLEAIFCIAEVERDEDKDFTFTRENWQSGPENRARGRAWLDQIYKSNHAATERTLAAHRDFEWLSIEITYGLYLSDHTIIGPVETELVVISGIMMQNLKRETGWHLRGMRRIGISSDDVETIQQCVRSLPSDVDGTDTLQIEKVASFCGLQLTRVPRVKDIEHEVVV